MTAKNIKIILFASLVATMILPFSVLQYADARDGLDEIFDFTGKPVLNLTPELSEEYEEFVEYEECEEFAEYEEFADGVVFVECEEAEKIQTSEERFAEFLQYAETQDEIQAMIDRLSHQENTEYLILELQYIMDWLHEEMNYLQQVEIEAVAIDPETLEALELQGEMVVNVLSDPTSDRYIVGYDVNYFVDQIERKIHVTLDKDPDGDNAQYIQPTTVDMDVVNEINGVEFTIGVHELNSHFIKCPDREKDCRYALGGLAIKEGGTSTLGFSAVQKDGDRGFVTTAHGVDKGDTVKQYPTRNIGVVDLETSEAKGKCDCAFVKVTNSKFSSVFKIYTSPNTSVSIASYETSGNPSIGTWLMQSGVSTDVKYTQYAGWDKNHQRMVYKLDSKKGDSGAPVTSRNSPIILYGMHTGDIGVYSLATPYAHLKTNLGLK